MLSLSGLLITPLPLPITIDMVKKAISKMKSDKAAGLSVTVVEMIKAGATMIRNLATEIICDGKVSTKWEQSFIVCLYKCLYKGKGDALDRGNYRGLRLTEQTMKMLERIVDGLVRQVVSSDASQFGFVTGRGTTDAIFVVQQLQDLEKALNFAHVPSRTLEALSVSSLGGPICR